MKDAAQRERFITGLDTNFSVQASAGAGKTRALVDRVFELAKRQPQALKSLVLVTYTNRAANEMRQRIRQTLLEGRFVAGASEPETLLITPELLEGLSRMFIGTIHAFALRLVSENAVYLGYPSEIRSLPENDPDMFRQWLRSAQMPESSWVQWLHRFLPERDLLSVVERLAKVTVDWAQLPPLDETALQTRIDETVVDASALETVRSNHPATKKTIARLKQELETLAQQVSNQSVGYLEIPENTSSAKELVAAWPGALESLAKTLAQLAKARVLQLVSAFQEYRLQQGQLYFSDQLVLAQRLLRHPTVRRRLLERGYRILLDEAQDTDPIQFSLLTELARPVDSAPFTWLQQNNQKLETRNPEPPLPGHFLMVGDAQQAIYGDRANLALYRQYHRALTTAPGGEALTFSTTFRCSRAVVDFVNARFAETLDGENDQAAFVPLEPKDQATSGSVVVWKPEGLDPENPNTLHLEARWLAEKLRIFTPQELGARHWGEVSILYPRKKGLLAVQQALRSVGLPSVLTFEPARYEHPEYLWLAALVYVLTHPGDEFEIVGLLRELEGVSDADIANYRWPDNANQRSLRLAAHPHDSDPVAQHLHRWHELVEAGEKKRKAHHSLYDVLLFWVEGSGLRSRLAALPEGTERVKGLDALLLRTAGELSELDSLKTLAEAWRAQSDWTMSAGAPEATEAIQLLTAQKAKGLEWDTVILPFLGQKIGDGSEKTYPQFQLPVGRPEYLLLRPSGRLTTEEWTQQDAGAEEQDNLERKRLAYVAVTRARRNLILIDDATLWAKTLKSGETKLPAPHLYAAMVPTRDEASYPPVALTECEALFGTEPESIPATPTSAPTSAPESVAALPLTPSLNLLKKHKPSEHSVEHEAEEESEKDEARPNLSDARTWPVAAPKDPIVYGLWWHEVMRLWPWSEAVKVQTAFAQDQLQLLPEALRPRGEHELQTLQSSPLAQQLSGLPATQILRELPYLRLLGTNTVEDGKMDFLYSLDRKTWRILDWKTDGDPTPSVLLEKYASQLDAYCEASRAHGLVVESTQLYATVNGQLIAV